MAFIILGSVGSALASGLAAVGLGTVGAAGAAGTGLAGAIGSAAGAVGGLGTSIASGIGSGLMAIGVPGTVVPGAAGAASTIGGAAGTIGTGITAAAGGAGMGAASSAAMGGDPGQGALMGGLTAGAMSGIGGLMGGATGGAGSAGSAVGDGLTTASEAMLNPTAAAAAPGMTTVGDVATQTAMGQVGAAVPELATQAAAPASSMFGGFGDDLTEMAVKEGMGMMKPEEAPAMAPRSGGGGRPKSRYDTEEEQQRPRSSGNLFANPFGGFAEGGLTTLKGGGISMREGQYVVPADVVSAIGNGSSKAGAKFLEQAFNHYIQNGPPEGVKPQQRAGSLAEQRMKERVQREAA